MQLFHLISLENLAEMLQILNCDNAVEGKAAASKGAFLEAKIFSTITDFSLWKELLVYFFLN